MESPPCGLVHLGSLGMGGFAESKAETQRTRCWMPGARMQLRSGTCAHTICAVWILQNESQVGLAIPMQIHTPPFFPHLQQVNEHDLIPRLQ